MIVRAYHAGPVPIRKFVARRTAQGVFWFSEDKEALLRGEKGAGSTKYLMTCELDVDSPAGWPEYEKLYLQQIKSEGFDSVKLDDDWIVFDPRRIKVLSARLTSKPSDS